MSCPRCESSFCWQCQRDLATFWDLVFRNSSAEREGGGVRESEREGESEGGRREMQSVY